MARQKTTRVKGSALLTVTTAAGLLLLGACASTQPNPRLTSAEESLNQAKANTARAELTAPELQQADAAIQRAQRAWRSDAETAEVDHLAGLAQRRIDLAVTAGQRRQTELAIEKSARERDAVALEASRRQTDVAQAQATVAQTRASEAAQRSAAMEASAAEERRRADALAARLNALEAKPTDRGLVVTFSDVLFDVGEASLRSGALSRVGQLADVMTEYPERNLLLEGFTDSTGSEEMNQQLSERRALSVRQALVMRNVDPRRIVTRGHAAMYPIADNGSAAGRQQNRRVEAILSDAKGELPLRR
jgi:outer membrane protein OmpA-like peptidoglycan-associated protein